MLNLKTIRFFAKLDLFILIVFCSLPMRLMASTTEKLRCPDSKSERTVEWEQKLNDSPLSLASCGETFVLQEDEDAIITRSYVLDIDGYKTNYEWQIYLTRKGTYFYWPDLYKVKKFKTSYSDITFHQLLVDGINLNLRKQVLWPIKRPLKTIKDIWEVVNKVAPYFTKLLGKNAVLPLEIVSKKLERKIAAVIELSENKFRMEIDLESLSSVEDEPFVYQSIVHELAHLQGLTDESATDMLASIVLAELASDGQEDFELALVARIIDQIMYAPFYLIAYNESLPVSGLDVAIRAPRMSSAQSLDNDTSSINQPKDFFTRSYNLINNQLLKERDSDLMDKYLDWKIQLQIIKPDEKESDRTHMWSLLNNKNFKNAIMAYGLLPYTAYKTIKKTGRIPQDFSSEMEILNSASLTGLQKYLNFVLKDNQTSPVK